MRRLLRSWRWRVAVVGHSMEPTLRESDWLLVDPIGSPRAGHLVVVHDPRADDRILVKRVTANDDGRLTFKSDHPAHAGEQIGLVERAGLVGVPWFRYWPPRRIGRV